MLMFEKRMKAFNPKGAALALLALAGTCFSQSPSVADGSSTWVAAGSPSSIPTPQGNNENCKATDMGNGTIVFEINFPVLQQYVEIFIRQNGIQNVAKAITYSSLSDAMVTYKYIGTGYKDGDIVEYRFYSISPSGQAVFTPGPSENSWKSFEAAGSEFVAPVTKDATLLLSSYCCGGNLADKNFGSNNSVDAGTYHHTAKGAFGFSLSGLPSGKVVTEAVLVFPALHSPGGAGAVQINKIDNSASWQEATVTWNNAPAYTYFNTFELPAYGPASMDITELVAAAVSAGEEEISIMMTPSRSNYFVDSKEAPSGKPAYISIKTR